MPRTASADDIAKLFLELLPSDGTPVANRVVRAMLSRSLETMISNDQYFQVVEQLTAAGKIGRARGRGGTVFAVDETAAAAESSSKPGPPAAAQWSEAALMQPLKSFLETEFIRYLDLPANSEHIVADTSTLGPRTGQWARPDFLVVTVMRFAIMPGRQVDVHSFELKASYGGSMQAVHEALAQTRFTHFGHLVWHVPHHSPTEVLLPEIEDHCRQHGLGFIIIREPTDLSTWEIRLDPVQKGTSPATVDAFLATRLPAAHRAKIQQAVQGG